MRSWCLVPAAGEGRRMGAARPKQFLELGGRPILVRTVEALAGWPGFAGLVVVAGVDRVDEVEALLQATGKGGFVTVTAGGDERSASVQKGLEALARRGADPDDLVFVHDGVRPFPPVERFDDLARAACPEGALLAVPCRDTLKRASGGRVGETVSRAGLWHAQTPQVFPFAVLEDALDRALRIGVPVTDEASAVEGMGLRPLLVEGHPGNLKVTLPSDLELAEALDLEAPGGRGLSIGHGYDVHRLVEERPLVLGGVEVAHEKGLLGHSDADVLAHAVGDACLGAAGLGDLGRHFPDTDDRWKGVSSLSLLTHIRTLLQGAGWQVARVDGTVVAQRPKLAPHVARMEQRLSEALGGEPGLVTVKATTTEQLGFEGREEGISAHAVALLQRVPPSDQ